MYDKAYKILSWVGLLVWVGVYIFAGVCVLGIFWCSSEVYVVGGPYNLDESLGDNYIVGEVGYVSLGDM
jgi:hypothetical protein